MAIAQKIRVPAHGLGELNDCLGADRSILRSDGARGMFCVSRLDLGMSPGRATTEGFYGEDGYTHIFRNKDGSFGALTSGQCDDDIGIHDR